MTAHVPVSKTVAESALNQFQIETQFGETIRANDRFRGNVTLYFGFESSTNLDAE